MAAFEFMLDFLQHGRAWADPAFKYDSTRIVLVVMLVDPQCKGCPHLQNQGFERDMV